MTAQELDVIVRVAGATLLIVAAARAWSLGLEGRLFAPFALCLCGFLAGNTPDESLRLSDPLRALAHVLSGYAAVFLWWFCLALFDRTFRSRGAVLAAGLAWIALASADRGLLGPAFADIGLSWALVTLGFGMVGHLAWRLLTDREGDLVDERRRARGLVVAALAGLLLADLIVDVALGLDWRPRGFAIGQNAAFLAFTGGLLWLMGRARRTLPAANRPATAVRGADPALAARLRVLIEDERAHLDPDLTFPRFVAMMGAPERTVRRFINQDLGHDHFRSFLNAQRMAEARRLLTDPARSGDKLIAIAMDSGFASLPSFNRVFQDTEGCAPSAFRKAAQAGF